jgi:hypothetical protein
VTMTEPPADWHHANGNAGWREDKAMRRPTHGSPNDWDAADWSMKRGPGALRPWRAAQDVVIDVGLA